jgi:hypothetical protein
MVFGICGEGNGTESSSNCSHGGNTYPLSKCLEVLESITPKAKKGYRDDMTAVLMKL